MADACSFPNCTVSQTGICINNLALELCPHHLRSDQEQAGLPPVLEAPIRKKNFKGSYALTSESVREITASRYCRLIGILGAPDAGKTAALICIYLLLSRNSLQSFEFRDSLTIRALDDLAEGARSWNGGNLPEQLSQHTELEVGRAAGYLHLKLKSVTAEQPVDFLFPDIPGEWTLDFVNKDRSDRLDFLRSADALWVVISGQSLLNRDSRMDALHRAGLLFDRLNEFYSGSRPAVIIVITWLDSGEVPAATLAKLEATAKSKGFAASVCSIASFARDSHVAPGTGIAELLNRSAGSEVNEPGPTWPATNSRNESRLMSRFRSS